MNVNGKEVDIKTVLPLTVGDWRKLSMNSGIEPEDVSRGVLKFFKLVEFIQFIIIKANPEITEEDVDTLSDKDFLTISDEINSISTEEVDRPL